MTTTAATRRELAHRESDGLQVSLFWSKSTNRVTVEVVDERLADRFAFDVPGRKALDAFHHPYAYAGDHTLDLPAASSHPLAA